jgi:hypothetical protein
MRRYRQPLIMALVAVVETALLVGCPDNPQQPAASEPDVVTSLLATTQPCPESAPVIDAGDLDASIATRLAPATILKVVRAQFGALRECYERGLGRNPKLAGRITTKFVIGGDGEVPLAKLLCTSMPDDITVECVVNAFRNLRFPAPDGGMVTVVYPIAFTPAD